MSTPSIVISPVHGDTVTVPSAAAGSEVIGAPRAPSMADAPAWVRGWRPDRSLRDCPPGGSHVFIVFDESGSVHSHADAISYRHALVGRVLDQLRGACRCGNCTVELVSFGRSRSADIAVAGPAAWTAGSRLMRELLVAAPATGSRLAGATASVQRSAAQRAGTSVVAVVSDFELFDTHPDPDQLYRDIAACGPSAAIVLRTDPVPAGIDAAGLRVITVNRGSAPTSAADGLIDLIADHRPDFPPPAPVNPLNPAPRSPGRAVSRVASAGRWWLLLVALLALVLIVALLSRHHSSASSHGGSTGGGGAAAAVLPRAPLGGASSAPAAALPPIVLPPPGGNAVRTVAAHTVIITDSDLANSPAARAALAAEFPVALRYQSTYGLAGDRLTLGPNGQLSAVADELAAIGTAPDLPALAPSDASADAIRAASAALTTADRPTADRIVVIVTDRVAAWSAALPAQPYPHPNVGVAHPEVRYYLVGIRSGASAAGSATLAGAGPREIDADPGVRGQVATALARAWVDGTDANWTGS